ncbi:GNAT family N-acetyltransferase [Pseudoalteromonas sp. GB56]
MPLSLEHWPVFLALHQDQSVMHYVADMQSEEHIRVRFEQRVGGNSHHTHKFCWAITCKQTSAVLGVIGYDLVNTSHAELGYMLLPRYQGCGYASEALNTVVGGTSQSHNITRFTATVTQGNEASRKLLINCDFIQLPTRSSGYVINGEEVNDWCFELCTYAQ